MYLKEQSIAPVFGFHEESITSKVKHVLVSCAATLMVPLIPTAAGTVCLLNLLFGPWDVLGITAFNSNSLCFDLS